MKSIAIAFVLTVIATPQAMAEQVAPTNPKPVKTIPIKPQKADPIRCEPGWTAVLLGNGKPMCARELREPIER
jgi:hypothetical protein